LLILILILFHSFITLSLTPPLYISLDNITLLDFMLSRGYTSKFLTCILFPMLSVVCTCSFASVGNYPASVPLTYLAQHGIFNLPWRKTCQCRVVGGVRKVARTLAEQASAVHLGVNISSIELGDKNNGKKPRVNFQTESGELKVDADKCRVLYTHVIVFIHV
jgi:predicted NAD/FAD-binding protein